MIREYITDDILSFNTLLYDRMLDVYGALDREINRDGIIQKSLNKPGTPYANYFVTYELYDEFSALKNFLKKNRLDVKTKMKLCLCIAEKLKMFHEANDCSVYLRHLTHDSIIVVEKNNTTYVPKIIKFDYAKIVKQNSSDSDGTTITLLDKVNNTSNKNRYCLNSEFNDKTDWEKVDVGSLGVLFIDICKGKITETSPDGLLKELLENNDIPKEMIELMGRMIVGNISLRPSLDNVIYEMKSQLKL